MTTPEFWRSIEAIHDVVYFAPEAKSRYAAIGLKGYWMSYVASRSAALGTPGPELVTATFHGFEPSMVAKAVPDAWSLADRDDVLRVRLDLAREALATPLGDQKNISAVANDLHRIASGVDMAGKPLAAAHRALHTPEDPFGKLWHAASVLREYRGDCHVAVLTSAGIGGAEANALAEATGRVPRGQRKGRGWSEDEWIVAYGRLQQFGWVDGNTATETGVAARNRLEEATDRACGAGFDQEATARAYALAPSLVPLARALEASGAITYPNPAGVPRP